MPEAGKFKGRAWQKSPEQQLKKRSHGTTKQSATMNAINANMVPKLEAGGHLRGKGLRRRPNIDAHVTT